MNPLDLVLVGIAVIGATGILAFVTAWTSRLATLVAIAGVIAGGAFGLTAALVALRDGFAGELVASWSVPGGALVIGLDPLSAFFLAPLFVLGPLCAVYGWRYLQARVMPAAQCNLLIALMAVVLIARHALLFLIAWEAMTLVAYLLITLDHDEAEVRRAGWVYLIASHVAVIALIALFVALGEPAAGALDFASLAAGWHTPQPGTGTVVVLVLSLVGFGIKAGLPGLHVWLPEAHAAAPSHVSALMSGMLIKLGIYGIVRMVFLVDAGSWFGVTLMSLGLAGALLGIALALYQRDLKRILAYSSIENIGIILLGLGLGLWARARGDTALAAIALGASFLHLWNHAAMKGLLFLSAGSIVHGTGTRDIEQLGGLTRRMPWTARALIIGAVAIAALPPLAGFTGEWLLYHALASEGLHGALPSSLAAIAGAALLALVGGLAALCFVRLVGVVLLGTPRSDRAAQAHESPLAMIAPISVLAIASILAAMVAPAMVSLQTTVLAQLQAAGAADVAVAADFLSPLMVVNATLLAAIVLTAVLLGWRVGRTRTAETWGCGYAAPTPRMQYTGHAFAEMFTTRVLPRWMRRRLAVHPPEGLFPGVASFSGDTSDPLTRAIYQPFLTRWADRFSRLRFLQQGNVHIYIVYILVAAIAALAWVAARDWLAV